MVRILNNNKKVPQICSCQDNFDSVLISFIFIIIWQIKAMSIYFYFADNCFINKPCPDSCNNMPLWSVFFYINGADRSTYGGLIPNWWSIIPINHIEFNVNISIKLWYASIRGTNSDSITLTL